MPPALASTLRSAALTAAAAATCLLPAGCRPGDQPLRSPLPPPTVNGVPAVPLREMAPRPAGDEALAVVLRHRIVSFELPLGSASASEELWSYIDEEPAGARRGPCLARNGIRVGLGREGDWPEIARLLRGMTAQRQSRASMVARPGHPASVTLKKGQPAQTIFLFRDDGTLFGNDYPPGDNLLVLTARVNLDRPDDVHLSGAPVVRSRYRQQRYERGPEGFLLTAKPIHYRLEELAFHFTVPRGRFVLVGPGPQADRATSAGHRFFVHQRRGERFEALLLIVPEAFAAAVRPTEPETVGVPPPPGAGLRPPAGEGAPGSNSVVHPVAPPDD